jgi:hypothetical protein
VSIRPRRRKFIRYFPDPNVNVAPSNPAPVSNVAALINNVSKFPVAVSINNISNTHLQIASYSSNPANSNNQNTPSTVSDPSQKATKKKSNSSDKTQSFDQTIEPKQKQLHRNMSKMK